ncbi:MAG: bifunctional nuclease family protein [Micrococcus sp.]|nr:bifunctional nuclease family protein [Micrococcus sp.]
MAEQDAEAQSAPDLPLTVLGVRVDLPTQNHALLLLTPDGSTVVPVWIGAPEATSVAMVLDGVHAPRPLTHDLTVAMLERLGEQIRSARLTAVNDDVFLAELVLVSGHRFDARPSDAIALALRTGAPVLAAQAVVDDAGVPVQDDDDADVDSFRRFIDDVDPSDFA